MQMISVVIKLQDFGRAIIQREAYVCKLNAVCMIQSNVRGMFVWSIIGLWLERSLRSSIIIQSRYRAYYCKKAFFKKRSGIISLQSFAILKIDMAQMIVRNDAARKSQIFSKLSLILIDHKKENASIIMIQSTFRMHKIRSQHKKIIPLFIYAELCKAHCYTKWIRVSKKHISPLFFQKQLQVILKSMMNSNR